MAASSRLMITEAERRFPVRIRVAVPGGGVGALHEIHSWLDANCGADGWAMTPAGLRGIVNDAVAIYFPGTGLATAFFGRGGGGLKTPGGGGGIRVWEDEPKGGGGAGG